MTALPREDRFPTRPRDTLVLEYRDRSREDRLPPQNLDAERSVLSGILLSCRAGDTSVLDDVRSILGPLDFYREAHQIVYRSMLVLHANGVGVDTVTVAEDLEGSGLFAQIGGDEGLGEIANAAPHEANTRFHAEIVLQKSVMRQVALLASETIERVYGNQFKSVEVVTLLNAGAQRLISASKGAKDEDDLNLLDAPRASLSKAYHGPLGTLCRTVEPFTEACMPAVLLQLLTAFGNVLGHGPYWTHEFTRHHLNLYACIVGPTGVGRKGTGWNVTSDAIQSIDGEWYDARVMQGIQSGEYLVECVADESVLRTGGYVPGVDDKRLLMLETEFERVMGLFVREGNSLGVYLRQFWESGRNSAGSRKNTIRCTDAHVSMVAHVTPRAVREQLSLTDVANGLGNRFIWCWSIQSKDLSQSRRRLERSSIKPVLGLLQRAADHIRALSKDGLEMRRDEAADDFWRDALETFRTPRPGHLGDMLTRGPAQVMRMAAIYAAADASFEINLPHIEAALELWDYCVRSVEYVFGDRLGDKDAEKLLQALREAGEPGLTQTQVFKQVFGGNFKAEKLGKLLAGMSQAGLIHKVAKKGGTDAPKGVTSWKLGPDLPHTPPYGFNVLTDSPPGGPVGPT